MKIGVIIKGIPLIDTRKKSVDMNALLKYCRDRLRKPSVIKDMVKNFCPVNGVYHSNLEALPVEVFTKATGILLDNTGFNKITDTRFLNIVVRYGKRYVVNDIYLTLMLGYLKGISKEAIEIKKKITYSCRIVGLTIRQFIQVKSHQGGSNHCLRLA